MGQFRTSAITASIASLTVACTHTAGIAPFRISLSGTDTSCIVTVDGRKVTLDQLSTVVKPHANPRRHAYIFSERGEAPYRCIAGAIYALQIAGFTHIEFGSEHQPGS